MTTSLWTTLTLAFTGTAHVAALSSLLKVRGHYCLKALCLVGTLGSLIPMFARRLWTESNYISLEWAIVLLAIGYAIELTAFDISLWPGVIVLWGSIFAYLAPPTAHWHYRPLIPLDVAALVALRAAYQAERGNIAKVATAYLALAFGLQVFHHAAWEVSASLARTFAAAHSIACTGAMLLIAWAAHGAGSGATPSETP